jgi:hypothetical protein
MSPDQISNLIMKKTATHARGLIFYDYNGKDIPEFNSVNISGITLGFYNNRLYLIGVDFGTIDIAYTNTQYELVHENLEANFGSDYHPCTNPNPEDLNCEMWDGSRVRVESIRVNTTEKDGTRNKNFNYMTGYMLFTEKNIQREQQRSEIEN